MKPTSGPCARFEAAEQLGDHQAALALLEQAVDLHPRVREPCGAGSPSSWCVSRMPPPSWASTRSSTVPSRRCSMPRTRTEQPLLVCELLVRREHLRFSTGRGFLRVEPVRRAAELSRPWPDSWQHGFALAEVAQASLWADEPDAQDAVSAAVEAAEAIGHPRVTAYAFAAAAMGAELSGRPGGPALAARGVQGAAEARDWWGFVHASLWEANTSQQRPCRRVGRASCARDGNSWPRWAGPTRTSPGSPSTRATRSSAPVTGGRRRSCSGSRSVPTRARR